MDRRMFRVIENFFTEDELNTLKKVSSNCLYESPYIPAEFFSKEHKKALEACFSFVEPEVVVGVEQWAFHTDFTPLPDKHQDRDEELFEKTGELSFPVCSCVVYLAIEDLVGAELEIGDTKIIPETGMLVLIAPEVWHRVTNIVSGKRHSLNYNFWNKPIYSS